MRSWGGGIRTHDLCLIRTVHLPLSYTPVGPGRAFETPRNQKRPPPSGWGDGRSGFARASCLPTGRRLPRASHTSRRDDDLAGDHAPPHDGAHRLRVNLFMNRRHRLLVSVRCVTWESTRGGLPSSRHLQYEGGANVFRKSVLFFDLVLIGPAQATSSMSRNTPRVRW